MPKIPRFILCITSIHHISGSKSAVQRWPKFFFIVVAVKSCDRMLPKCGEKRALDLESGEQILLGV